MAFGEGSTDKMSNYPQSKQTNVPLEKMTNSTSLTKNVETPHRVLLMRRILAPKAKQSTPSIRFGVYLCTS